MAGGYASLCKVLHDPEDLIGACLKKLGLPFESTDPAKGLVIIPLQQVEQMA